MSSTAPASLLRGRFGTAAGVSLVLVTGLATILVGVFSGGQAALTLAPILTVTMVFVVARVPLRWPSTVLVFLLLSLEVSGDAAGIWNSPLVHLGDLLSDISGSLTHVKLAGFEVAAVLLLAMAARRRSLGVKLDGEWAPVPGVIRDTLIVYLMGFAYMALLSVATGHGLPLWKVRYFIHLPLLYFFFDAAYPLDIDARPLGVAIVIAAQIKALLAAWVQNVEAINLTGGPLAYATNHGDSILFAMGIIIVVVAATERTSRGATLRAALLIPLPLWGLVLNRRRIAWAMLEVGVLMVFLLSSWRPWKKRLVSALAFGAPVILLYLAIGWNGSGTGVFGPVHKVRSMLDSSVDSSTYWREIEAWNIARTMHDRPLVGLGLGGEYTEYMQNDDISAGYPEYRAWPHNTVLGQLLLAGALGFAALWMPNLVTIFLAVRAYRRARVPLQGATALACVGAVVCCCFMAWGDTGVHFMQHKLAAALSMVIAGKLALSTGAWPLSGRPAVPDPPGQALERA